MTEEEEVKLTIPTTSPTIKKRRAEFDLKLREEKYENEYTTCCSKTGKTDKRLIQYASKFSLSLIVIAFACVQLIRADPCDSLVPYYSSLITFILGAWIKTNDNKTPST